MLRKHRERSDGLEIGDADLARYFFLRKALSWEDSREETRNTQSTPLYKFMYVHVYGARGQCWASSTLVAYFIFSRLGISLNLLFTQHTQGI